MTLSRPILLSEFPNQNSKFPFDLIVSEVRDRYPNHRHSFLEFSYVIEGKGCEKINGENHELSPGAFTFLLPYQFHEIISDSNHPLKLYSCAIGMTIIMGDHESGIGLEAILQSEPLLSPFVQFHGDEKKRMDELVKKLMREYRTQDKWSTVVIRGILLEIIAQFDRGRTNRGGGNSNFSTRITIWKVIDYIHTHYMDELNLKEVAERFYLSPPYLSKLFKETIGENFLSFVHDLRIRHACSLLMVSNLTMSEVAYEVGFGSYSSFSRVFFEKKGMSPTEFLDGISNKSDEMN